MEVFQVRANLVTVRYENMIADLTQVHIAFHTADPWAYKPMIEVVDPNN